MAKAREILKRITSIESTRKITRTMELVATSKLKRAQDRINATVPYAEKLNEMMDRLSAVPEEQRSGLMKGAATVERSAILLITSNRGLCGAYNTNLIRRANELLSAEREAGREVDLYVSGKKGIRFFSSRKIEMADTYLHLSDDVSFADANEMTEKFIRQFMAGEIQRFLIVFCHFHSAGRQYPTDWQILPVASEAEPEANKGSEEKAKVGSTEFIFEPDPGTILREIVPLSVKIKVLRALVEAQASEQSARRVAMKVATDNAGDIIGSLRRTYNKARQAAITQELAEIMGGVEALKG